jgi:hypothetical protein
MNAALSIQMPSAVTIQLEETQMDAGMTWDSNVRLKAYNGKK